MSLHLCTQPLNRQIRRVLIATVHSPLGGTTGHAIGIKRRLTIKTEQTISLGENRRGADRGSTSEGAVHDGARTLAARQGEAAVIAARGRGEGRARARRVPFAGRDDTALLAAGRVDVQVALAGEGRTGGCRRGRAGCGGRCRSGCGRATRALRQVLDAGAGAGGRGPNEVGGLEGASLDGASDVEEVPDFGQGAARAAEVD